MGAGLPEGWNQNLAGVAPSAQKAHAGMTRRLHGQRKFNRSRLQFLTRLILLNWILQKHAQIRRVALDKIVSRGRALNRKTMRDQRRNIEASARQHIEYGL